jgi:hypothetical protein
MYTLVPATCYTVCGMLLVGDESRILKILNFVVIANSVKAFKTFSVTKRKAFLYRKLLWICRSGSLLIYAHSVTQLLLLCFECQILFLSQLYSM